MNIEFLVTHSGGFHADELMSSVVLTKLFPAAKVVRTRSPEWIAPAADRIIYDVGGAFDPELRIFDHHQRGAPVRDDGRPFSSFGLIWRQYGMDYLAASGVPTERAAAVHAAFDRKFVLPIDLVDNGAIDPSIAGELAGLTLPALFDTLKPSFDARGEDADDKAFYAALAVATIFIEGGVRVQDAKLRAEALVLEAIKTTGDSKVLELPMGMPFRPAIVKAGAEHLLFVVHPRESDWCVTGIRRSDEGFELRADLPAAWAGLSNAELEKASGVAGATFCHKGRFIAAAKTRESALELARLAVEDVIAA